MARFSSLHESCVVHQTFTSCRAKLMCISWGLRTKGADILTLSLRESTPSFSTESWLNHVGRDRHPVHTPYKLRILLGARAPSPIVLDILAVEPELIYRHTLQSTPFPSKRAQCRCRGRAGQRLWGCKSPWRSRCPYACQYGRETKRNNKATSRIEIRSLLQ